MGDDGGPGCDSVAPMASSSKAHAVRSTAMAAPDSVARRRLMSRAVELAVPIQKWSW
jgi:hypothetical protein